MGTRKFRLDLELVSCSHHRNIVALQNGHKYWIKITSYINHCANLTHYRLEGQRTGLVHIIFTMKCGLFQKALPSCLNGLVVDKSYPVGTF